MSCRNALVRKRAPHINWGHCVLHRQKNVSKCDAAPKLVLLWNTLAVSCQSAIFIRDTYNNDDANSCNNEILFRDWTIW